MEDEPQLDTVLRAIDNNTWHAKRERKRKIWFVCNDSSGISSCSSPN